MEVSKRTILQVIPIEVVHSCEEPYNVKLVAKVQYKNNTEKIESFDYTGYCVMIDSKYAFDMFGRQIYLGYGIAKILTIEKSGAKTDNFIVELVNGTISWAEVSHTYTYGMGMTLRPGDHIPPARFKMRAMLSPVGEPFESIEALPNGMRVGYSGKYVSKMGNNYHFIEKGTGYITDLPFDPEPEENPFLNDEDDSSFAMDYIPKKNFAETKEYKVAARINTFCSKPVLENGKIYIDAVIDDVIHHLMIDPNYFDGYRLQPSDK